MDNRQQQRGIVTLIVIAIIVVVGIGYLLLSSTLLKTNKNSGLPNINNNTKSVVNNKTLQTACKSALNDYPQWTKADTDLIIWENPDKSFNFRNSPEDKSARLTSPVPNTETLADMDFVGLNKISFVTTGNNNWKISTLKLNGMGAYDKSQLYEKSEIVSYVNISPITEKEFITLIVIGNKGTLKQINTDSKVEENILEIPSIKTINFKLAVSPKGTYVYLLQNGSLTILEITSKKQIDKIESTESAVWVGNGYILYSGSGGTFVYNTATKEKSKIDSVASVSALTFNPKGNGIIAFDENGSTKIIDCQTWNIINSKQDAEFKTLTSEKTAITKKGDQFGYWRFKDKDWGVKILEDKSKFVTVWQRY